jgi:hypothetical protein
MAGFYRRTVADDSPSRVDTLMFPCCNFLLLTVVTIPMATACRVALCQVLVGTDKVANLATAVAAIATAASNKANIVALPECFNR